MRLAYGFILAFFCVGIVRGLYPVDKIKLRSEVGVMQNRATIRAEVARGLMQADKRVRKMSLAALKTMDRKSGKNYLSRGAETRRETLEFDGKQVDCDVEYNYRHNRKVIVRLDNNTMMSAPL